MAMNRSFQHDSVEFHFTDQGNAASAVLLIHGHPFDETMWRPQVEFLESSYRVIVPDLRVYGKSGIAAAATVDGRANCFGDVPAGPK